MAFYALVESIGTSAIAVAIALTLNGTIGPYVTEIASTFVRLDTSSSHASFFANWYAFTKYGK